jgi:hypothetical protein
MKLNFHTPIKSKKDLKHILKLLKDKNCIQTTIAYGTTIGDEYTLEELENAELIDFDIEAINVGLYLPRLTTEIPKTIVLKDYLLCSLVTSEEWGNKMDYAKKKVAITDFEQNLDKILNKGEKWLSEVYNSLQEELNKCSNVIIGNKIITNYGTKEIKGFYFFSGLDKHPYEWCIQTDTGVSDFKDIKSKNETKGKVFF